MVEVYLIDTNILVRACQDSSPFRPVCVEVLEKASLSSTSVGVVSTRILIEFYVVATRPEGENGLGWSLERARAKLDFLRLSIDCLPEPPDIMRHWTG